MMHVKLFVDTFIIPHGQMWLILVAEDFYGYIPQPFLSPTRNFSEIEFLWKGPSLLPETGKPGHFTT